MRRASIPATAAALALAAFSAACSKSETEDTPTACLEGPRAYVEVGGTGTPYAIQLADGTRISDCLTSDQEAGDLAEVGATMVTVATQLNEEARDDPGAAVRLGFLVGAAERGAEDTAGIHNDLILRLNSAARFDPSRKPSLEFERAFDRGYQAGKETG